MIQTWKELTRRKMVTFRQLAPLWYAKLKEDFKNIGKVCHRGDVEMDIQHPVTCVLGETWNFSSSYFSVLSSHGYCHKCMGLSSSFGEVGSMANQLELHPRQKSVDFERWDDAHDYNQYDDDQEDTIEITWEYVKERLEKLKKELVKHVDKEHPQLILEKLKEKNKIKK